MVNVSNVAEIGSLLGDPARVNMMIALIDGRSKTAGELADAAGVSPQTASSHLAKLRAAGMIELDRQGRHHYHRLASPEVARLIEQMHVAGATLADGQRRTHGPRDPAMRTLRSCYDHLAGSVAVEICGQLIPAGGQVPGDTVITSRGSALLAAIGIQVEQIERGRRHFCRTCLDWSERRPHLSGAVGAALLERLKDLSWVRQRSSARTLDLTPAGERGLREAFGLNFNPMV
jgi:DNA-binding transcriptional ArsR family regulator